MNINKTKVDLEIAKEILADTNANEYQIDAAAYHVQQAIEKNLKYYLSNIYGDNENVREFKTHSISALINKCVRHGMAITDFPDELIDNAETITSWEAGARYGVETVSEREDVEIAFQIATDMYHQIQQIEQKRQIYNAMEEKLAEFDLENYELQDDDIDTAFAMLENGVYFDDAVGDALQCIYDKEYGTEKE